MTINGYLPVLLLSMAERKVLGNLRKPTCQPMAQTVHNFFDEKGNIRVYYTDLIINTHIFMNLNLMNES